MLAFAAMPAASGGTPSGGCMESDAGESGLECCQAASTRSRLTWEFPVFVMGPLATELPEEDSEGTSPT